MKTTIFFYDASKLATFFEQDPRPKHFLDETMMAEGKFVGKKEEFGAFIHNPIPIGSMACVMQNLMRHLNPPDLTDESLPFDDEEEKTKIIGAKLIRIQNAEWEPEDAARFFLENFPCARFIFNERSNIGNQLKSMDSAFWWTKKHGKDYRETKKDELIEQIDFLKKLHNILGKSRSKLIDMTKWKDDVSILNNVVEWLGYENCSFDTMLHENHNRYKPDRETKLHMGENCQLVE